MLIAVNLFINYFILLSTVGFLNIKPSKIKILFGAFLGSIFSLCIIFPDQSKFFSLALKFFISAVIVWVAICSPKEKIYVKAMLCFYSISFSISGIMFAIWFIFRPNGLFIKNGIVYFGISPVVLICSTVISYFIIELINKNVGKKELKEAFCEVKVKISENTIFFKAKIDTGNLIKEPFSGLSVVVVNKKILKSDLFYNFSDIYDFFENVDKPEYIKCNLKNKLRLIPFYSVAGKGVLPAFKPDYIEINGSKVKKDAYLAVCRHEFLQEGFDGLVSPELLD